MDHNESTPTVHPHPTCDPQRLAAFVLSQLTDREYEVVMLANSSRRTYREVAEELDLTVGEVKAAVRSSHEVLRLARALL